MVVSIERIGNSCGIVLPEEVMHEYHLREGDLLEVMSEGDSIRLTLANPFAALDMLDRREDDSRTSIEIAEDLRRSLGEERTFLG